MKKWITLALLLLTVALGCKGEQRVRHQGPSADFQPGQVWTYKTRPDEQESRVVVCRVERDQKLGAIVHVQVEGVAIKSPSSPGGVARIIGHMPFAEKALRASVVNLEATRQALPEFEDGYATWKQAFDAGDAGVFSVSVAEGVGFMEQTLSR